MRKPTTEIVDYIFRVVKADGQAAADDLPMRLRCSSCHRLLFVEVDIWGIQKASCGYMCPSFVWPMQAPALLVNTYLDARTPTTVAVLEWDYTTKPAHSRFVYRSSGPEFEAEVRAFEQAAWDKMVREAER